jgi:Lar family restriction alleviation protein
MENEVLKPCPYCGNTGLTVNINHNCCFIQCDECGGRSGDTKTQASAIEIWNTRFDQERKEQQ